MDQQKLKKGICFAAMMTYIRTSVCELMTPAAPYILRFNISDYTYFTDYVRERALAQIYAAGLYKAFLEASGDVQSYIMSVQGKQFEKYDKWTVEKLEDENETPLSQDPCTWDPRLPTAENPALAEAGAGGAFSDPELADAARTAVNKVVKDFAKNDDRSLYDQFMELQLEDKEIFIKKWKKLEQDKNQIDFETGAEVQGINPDMGGIDKSQGGNRTPYMLSNYFSNVFPLGERRYEAAVEEDSEWAKMGSWLMDMKMFSINGIPVAPDEALKRALMLMCINVDAIGAYHASDERWNSKPARADDWGVLGFQAYPKPPMVSNSDILDAMIVMETTLFIQRIKQMKEDPLNDWDWPLDFPQKFFGKLLPKFNINSATATTQHQMFKNFGESEGAEADLRNTMFPHKIMYVPVLDCAGEATSGPYDSTKTRHTLLKNFPWDFKYTTYADDGRLTPEEASKVVLQPYFDENGIPSISETQGASRVLHERESWSEEHESAYGIKDPRDTSTWEGDSSWRANQKGYLAGGVQRFVFRLNTGKVEVGSDEATVAGWDKGYIEDKYNGGAAFHIRTGGFVLQLFAHVDSYLWERVDQDFKSIESHGLKDLLYLFRNRGPMLKGAVNPHYWNACMKAFFEKLDQKVSGGELDYTHGFEGSDLDMFKNRMGAEYANVHMGLRLCWMVPSNMPGVYDKRDPTTGLVWWEKDEYGDADLIAGYKAINSLDEKHRDKMREMFMKDKAHVYVMNHQQPEVWHPTADHSTINPFDFTTETLKAKTDIKEYAFCFPLCEVITDDPVPLDPENWNITSEALSLKRHPDHSLHHLIKKMAKSEDFKVLFDYIFPINSIIPEIATIYGMEFFKPVADYMKVRKGYFQPVRATAQNIVTSFDDNITYNDDYAERIPPLDK